MILDPQIVHGLQIIAERARRLEAVQSPEAIAALDHQRKREAIATAAYEGTAEHRAAMKAARQTGDAELIAIEVGLANARVAAALHAFDAVFGGGCEPDAGRASGGDPMKSEGVEI